jgi:hypothetical protein
VEANERIARGWDERGEACEELERGHDAMLGSRSRVLHSVGDASVSQAAQSVQGEGRPRSITEESLASEIVASGDGDAGVEVPAQVVGDQGEELGLFGGDGCGLAFDEPGERAPLHGNGRACLDRAGLGIVLTSSVEVAVPAKPGDGALVGTSDDGVELVASRGRERVEMQLVVFVAAEDAVEEDVVEVNVQV